MRRLAPHVGDTVTDDPKPRRQGPRPRYISKTTQALLNFSFRGKIPALVIAEALQEKARREGRPLPPEEGRAS
jgi:hypothetical protein